MGGTKRAASLLVAALLAGGSLAACGGGDGDDSSATTVDSGGDSNGSDDTTGGIPNFGDADCQALIDASLGFAAAFGGQGDSTEIDFGQFADAFAAFADEAPDELQDDINLLADAYRDLDDSLGGPVDFSDPETLQNPEVQAAFESFSDPQFQEATENISTFASENCNIDAN